MAPDYINELAKRAFTKISPDEWKQSEKISRYLREKPDTDLALAQELESQVPLQAEIAWHIGCTPSKWLLENELLEVQKRRDQHDIRNKGTQPPAAKSKDTEEDAYVRAANLGLMGLCLSGGGIRSATFNLGILQGLAELKLLSCFDYLASVSGGGYIHQWLAAWISRESKNRSDTAKAKGLPEDQVKTAQVEGFREVNRQLIPLLDIGSPASHPEPIRWLRRYSNYLTPEKGLFTADTWVTIAIWLRNTLLNQTILVSSLLFVMLFPHLLTFGWFVPTSHCAIVMSIAAIVYLFLMAAALVGRELSLLQLTEPDCEKLFLGQSCVQAWIVFPLLLASLVVTLLFPIGALGIDFVWAWVLVPILYAVLTLKVIFAGGTLTSYLKSHHFIAANENAKDFWGRQWCFAHVRAVIALVLLVLVALVAAIGGGTWHLLVSLMTVWLPNTCATHLWRLELVKIGRAHV